MFITFHDPKGRAFILPAEISGKPAIMPWRAYAQMLKDAALTNNSGAIDVRITLHVSAKEAESIARELHSNLYPQTPEASILNQICMGSQRLQGIELKQDIPLYK